MIMATLHHSLGNIISVPFTMTKLMFMKCVMYRHNLFYKGIERFSPNVVIGIDKKSKIEFGNRTSIHSNSRFSAVEGGELIIHDNCSFQTGCIITARAKIEIYQNVIFGPNIMVFDHDHLMEADKNIKESGYKLANIVIGSNTWVGAGTIILAGTNIGNNCVIGAGSVVKGDIPDNTIFIQKREKIQKKNE